MPGARSRRSRRDRWCGRGHRAGGRPYGRRDDLRAHPEGTRGQADHGPDQRMVRRAQRGTAAHRMPDKHHGDLTRGLGELVEGTPRVVRGVRARTVPAPVPVADPSHQHGVPRCGLGDPRADGPHPGLRQVPRRRWPQPVGPAPVQEQHRRPGGRAGPGDYQSGLLHAVIPRFGHARDFLSGRFLAGVRAAVPPGPHVVLRGRTRSGLPPRIMRRASGPAGGAGVPAVRRFCRRPPLPAPAGTRRSPRAPHRTAPSR